MASITIIGGVTITGGITLTVPSGSATPIKSVVFSDMELISTSLLMLNTSLTTNAGVTPAKSYTQSILFGSD
jgi:hypothetical protein